MTKQSIALLVVGALIVGGIFGYVIHPKSYGTTYVGYQTSQGNQLLYNALSSLITDVTNARAPLSGLISSSTIFGPQIPALATVTTTLTTANATSSDLVLVSGSSTLPAGVNVYAYVSGLGTTSIVFANNTTSTQNIASSSWNVRVLPAASFVVPTAIGTQATTTTY